METDLSIDGYNTVQYFGISNVPSTYTCFELYAWSMINGSTYKVSIGLNTREMNSKPVIHSVDQHGVPFYFYYSRGWEDEPIRIAKIFYDLSALTDKETVDLDGVVTVNKEPNIYDGYLYLKIILW